MRLLDLIYFQISRGDVATIIAETLASPNAAMKTFELRRSDALGDEGFSMTPSSYNAMFISLVDDWSRMKAGIRPFPSYVDPPAPPDEETVKSILQQVNQIQMASQKTGA